MKLRRYRILNLAIALTLLGSAASDAQFGRNKDKDKAEANREKQQRREEKNLKVYDKIKIYSHDKYSSDPDFRDDVDRTYNDLLRKHMEEAYERNIDRGSHIRAVHEDRFREHTGLYDNLLVQDDINRLGQSLVPAGSDRVFAFRLLPDPTPTAYTLSTGTIYISTGMVSLLESQAQLSYVLAHEMAHVQLEHWKDLVTMQRGLESYNVDQGRKAEKIAILGSVAGALAGGLGGRNAATAVVGAGGGFAIGAIAGALMNRQAVVEWDTAQEDEADKLAFKVMLDSRYDVREVPKLFTNMASLSSHDARMTLGFLGERSRLRERQENANRLVNEAYRAEIEAGLKKGFIGDTATHRNLMAELKRDNGIMAYYNDMFDIARKNLSEAVAIRDNDPEAQYFYGKTLETIGRSDDERRVALQAFQKAAQYDTRKQNFGSHLHYALALMEDNKNAESKHISDELDNYVSAWFAYLPEARKDEFLPPSLDSIYDYMAVYSSVIWHPKLPAQLDAVKVDYDSCSHPGVHSESVVAASESLKPVQKSLLPRTIPTSKATVKATAAAAITNR